MQFMCEKLSFRYDKHSLSFQRHIQKQPLINKDLKVYNYKYCKYTMKCDDAWGD